MSAVIVKLAEPLLEKYGTDPKSVQRILAIAMAAWNRAVIPADKQHLGKRILDSLVPPNSSAAAIGTITYVMDLIGERRKELFPHLRQFIVDYEFGMSEGEVTLNIVSAPI